MPDTTIKYYTTHVKGLVRRYESAEVPDLHALLVDSFPPDEFDAKGRRFTSLTHAEWTGLCCRAGLDIRIAMVNDAVEP
ncbi:MAG: hypothetical protein RQ739_13660 [Desulfotignum sp.]|nr:hypothetical protein [Desulfotignum sp.]